jgi:hypothetical protein
MDKANKAILAIVVIGISVYLGFTPLYEKVEGGVAGAVIGASFGAIFVVILTNYLLTKQTEVEQESKRGEKVFEEKVELYKEILKNTEEMIEDETISKSDEMKKLPFLMLKLQMLGNDDAIKSYEQIYTKIIDIFNNEPENDEVRLDEDAQTEIHSFLSEFCNVCRVDLKVSDTKIDSNLFNKINENFKTSNRIRLDPNNNIAKVHDLIIKKNSSINLKSVKRDYVAWQMPEWPSKVEYQIVSRQKLKKFIVQISSEQRSGKDVAAKLEEILPKFKEKFPEFTWTYGDWYSDYNNRIFTKVDINEPDKAVDIYLRIIDESKDMVDKLIKETK